MREPQLLIFFGHHKAASTWMSLILLETARRLGLRSRIVYTERDFGEDLAGYYRRERPRVLVYANADREHLDGLPPFLGIHMIRDPRDVVVSGYFSHLKTHPTHAWPELEVHRQRLQSQNKEEGLLAEIEFSAPFLQHMGNWDYSTPHVCELKYEEVFQDPYRHVVEAFEFLGLISDPQGSYWRHARATARSVFRLATARGFGLEHSLRGASLPRAEILDITYANRFEAKRGGKKAGSEDRSRHFRKGIAGDWKNHFTPVHKQVFKERYGDLVVRLGYETDNDW